nr:hypothetical protein [Tanacetum cinerariifolium]
MWKDLKDTYDKVDGSIVFNLHKKINSLTQNGASLVEYYNNLNSLWKQFDAMTGHNVDRCFELVGYLTGYVKKNFNANTRPISSNNAYVPADIHSNNDLRANMTVGIGNQCNGLYLFDVDNASKIVFNNCNSSCFVSKTLWHQRLGHPVDKVLGVLKTTLNIDSHSTSDHLYDTYVWGPYKVISRDDFRYFLTIVDDFSKAVWVYKLKGKDDVYDSIGNDDSEATYMEENNNTHHEDIVSNETNFVNDFYENSKFNSEVEDLPVNTDRRSSRQTKLPTSLNDFIIDGKVKYGVEKVVNYANLIHENLCFASSLTKSIEPTCYKYAILDNNWVDAMNAKIEALNKNQT